MNHHQVVHDVQSKLPRRVQLQHVTLLTRTLPEHTHTQFTHYTYTSMQYNAQVCMYYCLCCKCVSLPR